MATEIWYRGESTSVPPAQPGEHLHDFGDGLYLTESIEVAELYAKTRAARGGGTLQVLKVGLQRDQLGRVLDLSADPRWQVYMRTRVTPQSPTFEDLIRAANENYSRFFNAFIREKRIDLNAYDAVVGPEFVRGGKQLCILHVNGRPAPLALEIRSRLRPVGGSKPLSLAKPIPLIPARSRLGPRGRGIAGNQNAVAMFGQLLAGALQTLGEVGIRRRVQQEIDTRHAAGIQRILSQGMGVLVIVAIQESIQADFNGVHARMFLSSYIQGGLSQESAFEAWHGEPRLLQGPARGFRVVEEYAWIDPSL